MVSTKSDIYAAEVLTSPQEFIDVPEAKVVDSGNQGVSEPSETDGFLGSLQQDARVQGVLSVTKVELWVKFFLLYCF